MTITELKEIREKIARENKGKQRMRRENERCFIPEEYYTMRLTHKQLFVMQLKRRLNELNAQSIIIEESDKRCVL